MRSLSMIPIKFNDLSQVNNIAGTYSTPYSIKIVQGFDRIGGGKGQKQPYVFAHYQRTLTKLPSRWHNEVRLT